MQIFLPTHVKWFSEVTTSKTHLLHLNDPAVIIWMIIIATMTIAAYFLNKNLKPARQTFLDKVKKHSNLLTYIFQALIGISLIYTAAMGSLLVPTYEAHTVLQIFEIVIGAILIINRGVPFAALGLLALYIIAGATNGWIDNLDNVHYIGIALYLIFLKEKFPIDFKHSDHKYALPILRVFTGLALIIPALSEKLLAPEKSQYLIDQHHWNFMSNIGFENFSDQLFILSAGSVEILFGLIFILGFITRINTIALLIFFIATNIYFVVFGYINEALMELMGHLPIIAIAILFIAHGSGNIKRK